MTTTQLCYRTFLSVVPPAATRLSHKNTVKLSTQLGLFIISIEKSKESGINSQLL